jgi:hypothetical protein
MTEPTTVLREGTAPGQTLTAEIQFAGPMVGKPRFDAVDKAKRNLVLEPHTVTVREARSTGVDLTTFGFAALPHRSSSIARAGQPDFQTRYESELVEWVRDVARTPHVFPHSEGFMLRGGDSSAKPARFAHMDFTAQAASDIAKLVARRNAFDVAYDDFAIFQTWRVLLSPPYDSTLALCDGRTVKETDWLAYEAVTGPEDEPGNVTSGRIGRWDESPQWFYFADLRPDEVIVFNGYDSRQPYALNVLHSAVSLDSTQSPRVSVEARFIAYFGD